MFVVTELVIETTCKEYGKKHTDAKNFILILICK
jgi:hypothetical protein